jgi:N-acetyl-anhydromuramyl-L-alanine amidase AmpD
MSFETDNWEYIPAKWQKHWNTRRNVIWIVIHDMEAPETEGRARACAVYFQDPPRPGSSHVTVDDKEVIQCVRDNDEAAGAIGANQLGVHIEIPGVAVQTPGDWADVYSAAAIENAADVAAQYCLKFEIPVKHLTNAELGARQKGIVGHIQVSAVFPVSGHTDPGVNFPWDHFMDRVQANYDRRSAAQ